MCSSHGGRELPLRVPERDLSHLAIRRCQTLKRLEESVEKRSLAKELAAHPDKNRVTVGFAIDGGHCRRERHRVELRWRGAEDLVELFKDRDGIGRSPIFE